MQKRQLSDRAVIIGSIVGLVALVLLCTLLSGLVTQIMAWMPLMAGAILVIGNRHLIGEILRGRGANSVFNLLVGIALVLLGLGVALNAISIVFIIPALLLLLAALPMALNKSSVTDTYRSWFVAITNVIGRKADGVNARYRSQQAGAAQPPIDLDSGTVTPGVTFDPSIYNTPKDHQQR
ncbi:MAG TPA: hypothetical protein VGE07_22460 [Herpetosiphonaceae bacterium]